MHRNISLHPEGSEKWTSTRMLCIVKRLINSQKFILNQPVFTYTNKNIKIKPNIILLAPNPVYLVIAIIEIYIHFLLRNYSFLIHSNLLLYLQSCNNIKERKIIF